MSNVPHLPARLLIHVDGAHPAAPRHVSNPLRRIGDFCSGRRSAPVVVPLSLRVEHVDGHCVLALASAGCLVDLHLLPGRYHVISQRGPERRVHTLCLEAGACVNLDLNVRAGYSTSSG